MRGKAEITRTKFDTVGITPAYAGKRNPHSPHFVSSGDHPRLCGEKLHTVCNFLGVLGSPPPMRGKVCQRSLVAIYLRITPAYAGKRSLCESCPRQAQDHPRLCGEKVAMRKLSKAGTGSPPPMRGKALVVSSCISTCGITPAYAGKSSPPDDVMSVL